MSLHSLIVEVAMMTEVDELQLGHTESDTSVLT